MIHGNVNTIVTLCAVDSNISTARDVDLVVKRKVYACKYDVDAVNVDRSPDNDRWICVLIDRCLVNKFVFSRIGIGTFSKNI